MATRVEVFEVVIPALTLESSPLDTELDFVPARVDQLEVLIPPGPSGLVGWAILHNTQQILPFATGSFIFADGEVIRWPLERFPTGRGWIVRAFNTDIFDHTLHIRLLVSDARADDGAAVAQVTGTEVDTSEVAGLAGVISA